MAEAINAVVGGWFKVVLQRSGGTNYGWCLSDLPKGVVLTGSDNECTGPYPGAPVNQTFYFLVTGLPEGDRRLAFQMVCLSSPDKSLSDETIIDLNITAANSNPLGASNFVQYSENMAVAQAAIPYGFPWVQDNPSANANAGNMKYGYPCDTLVKYGYPTQGQGYDASNMVSAYAFPDDLAAQQCAAQAPVKYGYPGCEAQYLGQNALKYGYPGCDPVMKYGYPGCDMPMQYAVQPGVKYGYPGCDHAVKYGYPGSEYVVKYGYPGCGSELYAGQAAFKYGYPGCDPVIKYGYPGCDPVMKYGYPGCR